MAPPQRFREWSLGLRHTASIANSYYPSDTSEGLFVCGSGAEAVLPCSHAEELREVVTRNSLTGYSCRASPPAVWPEASVIASLSFHFVVVLHRLGRGGCGWASLAGC